MRPAGILILLAINSRCLIGTDVYSAFLLLFASLEPYPGLEPGTPAWKAEMLTTTPIGQMLEPHVGLEPTTFSMARRYATNCINGT